VPNSRLQNHFPNPAPEGNTGPQGVMSAWSGGAFDSSRDRLIVWGGGHLDYSGNELYVFDVINLQWTRLTEPSPSITQNVARYPDGLPSSRHTYNYIQYSPDKDYFISLGCSACYGDPSYDGPEVDAYDFTDGDWITLTSKPSNGYNVGSFSAYDPDTGYLWHHGSLNGRLARYDPAGNSWATYAGTDLELYMTADVDPDRHIMVGVGGNQGVRSWNLENPNAGSQKRTTSGDNTLESRSAPGFAFDPALEQFVGWSGGSSVYTLDPTNWEWSEIQGGGATPGSADSNGTYGRFRYIPSKNAYIAVNRTSENVFLFKLTAGLGSTLPRINLSASPTVVQAGGSSTISWTVSNADSCTASGGTLSGAVGLSGSEIVGPLSADLTISVTCSQSGGAQVVRRVTVCVGGACTPASGSSSGGPDPDETDSDPLGDDDGGGALGLWVLLLSTLLLVIRSRVFGRP
jgi:hypothetical protein